MKKTLSLTLCASACLFASFSGYSQSKYGKTTKEEIETTAYEKDPTASAVILLNCGETHFIYNDYRDNFQLETTISKKIKILKSDALDLCNQTLVYYTYSSKLKESIEGLEGAVYNLVNGKIEKTKLKKDYIQDEENDRGVHLLKFTLPGAKAGSVIEFRYRLVSDLFWQVRDFYFQDEYPVEHSSYEVVIPEYFSFNLQKLGYSFFDVAETNPTNENFSVRYRASDGTVRSEYVTASATQRLYKVNNLPAFKSENMVWSKNDFRDHISFELRSVQFPFSLTKNFTSSWEQIDKDLFNSAYLGDNIKRSGLFSNEFKNMEPNYDNALAILNSVKDRVKWNGEESFYPTGLKDALKKSLGNSADINYLAINALKSADFTAFPVIMRTRNNGILPWYPTVDAFNYVITGLIIDGTSYYTDASVKYSTWNLLPQKCMVTQARLMLGEGQCQWADLSLLSEGQDMTMAYSSFEGNSLVRKVERTLNGNDALTFRSQYYSLSDKSKLTDLLASKMDMQIEDMQINGLDSYSEPVALSFTGKTEVDLTDDILYINPSVDRVISGNPFKDEVRLYPVQFPCKESFIVLNTIQIPAGYEIEELPKAERILFGEGDIVFTHGITATGESIQMQHVYQMKRIQYLPEEYDDLRDFFGKIIAKYDELIVLKKKTVD